MSPTPGYVHHDRIRHAPHVDLAWDLRQYPWTFAARGNDVIVASPLQATLAANDLKTGLGEVRVAGFLDEILALDVFEHLGVEIQPWLDESWRLLRPNGLLDFRVPAWDHELSYRDPTHWRTYHPETFLYWDPDHGLHQAFGAIYFAESGRWWKQEECFRENNDLRFRLRKRA